MNNNRALEFLAEAYNLLGYFGNDGQARLLVRLAIGEVQELLEQLAATGDGSGALVVDAQQMTPAKLTARHSAALPGGL